MIEHTTSNWFVYYRFITPIMDCYKHYVLKDIFNSDENVTLAFIASYHQQPNKLMFS